MPLIDVFKNILDRFALCQKEIKKERRKEKSLAKKLAMLEERESLGLELRRQEDSSFKRGPKLIGSIKHESRT